MKKYSYNQIISIAQQIKKPIENVKRDNLDFIVASLGGVIIKSNRLMGVKENAFFCTIENLNKLSEVQRDEAAKILEKEKCVNFMIFVPENTIFDELYTWAGIGSWILHKEIGLVKENEDKSLFLESIYFALEIMLPDSLFEPVNGMSDEKLSVLFQQSEYVIRLKKRILLKKDTCYG